MPIFLDHQLTIKRSYYSYISNQNKERVMISLKPKKNAY